MRILLALAVLLLATPTYAQQWKAGSASGAWQSDSAIAQGGTVSSSPYAAPYNSHRWGEFTLAVPVANGRYSVKLHWQEVWAATGQRVFHVDIEGARVETSLDVAKLAGREPLVRTYTADVTDGALTVRFVDGGPDDPMYSAIEVTAVSSPAPQPPTGPTWTGEATFGWTPPTTNTDGSTLTDLAGYLIEYGNTAETLDREVSVPGAGTTSYTLTGLPQGRYFAGIRSVTTAGAQSELSDVIEFQVTDSLPACTTKPADETRTQTCVLPAVGSWTQTRSYTTSPYPTCWTAGEWLPASAPSGACVVPAPVERWVVAPVSSGSRPVYEVVRNADDTADVRGTVQGRIQPGKPCGAERFRVSRNSYRDVDEADIMLDSPTYKGREHTAICIQQ